ncbi:hypothetical protein WJX72_005744 [[Myrmecia] bisecta]|uniref:Nucleotide-diphospho-sugar transferase domain-containing protein n=1 Tax=[Myrmecia] bisecta TaxID=41462 RepID=A0AAW1Q0E8_9CHLO
MVVFLGDPTANLHSLHAETGKDVAAAVTHMLAVPLANTIQKQQTAASPKPSKASASNSERTKATVLSSLLVALLACCAAGLLRLHRPQTLDLCKDWCSARNLMGGPYPQCVEGCLKEPSVVHYMGWLEASRDDAPRASGNSSDIIFGIWFSQGDRGAEGHDGHQFAGPNLAFASALQKSHPGCRIVILSDQDARDETWRMADGQQLEVFRMTIDKSKLGRNAYANYYQYLAQIAFMRNLTRQGLDASFNIVFMDMDILVVDSIAEVFSGADYDYALSISDATTMPINLGVQFIRKGRYEGAIEFLCGVINVYPFHETFVAGQIALGDYVELRNNERAVYATQTAAVREARACKQAGNSTVCFLTCLRYNYCHTDESCCTDAARLPISLQSFDELQRARPKMLHFVGHRKPALNLVHRAFMKGGREAAYAMWSVLPHTEAAYQLLKPFLEQHAM